MGMARKGKAFMDWVYVFFNGYDAYKIGTGNVVDRWRQGKTWNAKPLIEVCRIQCECGHVLEARLHARYQHRRTEGDGQEWFYLSVFDLQELKSYENSTSAFDWQQADPIRSIHGIERCEAGANRESVLDTPIRGLHSNNQPVLVAVSREHEVRNETVLRTERKEDRHGNQQLFEHQAKRVGANKRRKAVSPLQLYFGF